MLKNPQMEFLIGEWRRLEKKRSIFHLAGA